MASIRLVTQPLPSYIQQMHLYKETAPTSIIDSITTMPTITVDGVRIWEFFDLVPGEVYRYRWIQVNGGGTFISQIASHTFTVDDSGNTEIVIDYLTADTTAGVFSGMTGFTMDGTDGKSDWRGKELVLEHRGFGTMFPGKHYTFNSTTGEVALLADDATPYDIETGEEWIAKTMLTRQTSVVVKGAFTDIKYVTANTTLVATDFGKNLIQVNGASGYLEITLPFIATVAENRPLLIKSGRGSHKCFAIISQDANAIDFLYGNMGRMYVSAGAFLEIYRQNNDGVNTWQVLPGAGNWYNVGAIVNEHTPVANVFNKIAANDTAYSVTDYANVYDYVLRLPGGEVVSFAAWSANQGKWSLSNGTHFHVPNYDNRFGRTGLTNAEAPGIIRNDQALDHRHEETIGTLPTSLFGRGVVDRLEGRYSGSPAVGKTDLTGSPVTALGGTIANVGDETYPKHLTHRTYILC